MLFGICLQSIIPVRMEPSHQSEMVTQILFGELYRVYESRDGWHRVMLSYDNYEGWIDHRQATGLEEEEYLKLLHADTPCSLDLVQLLANETRKTVFPIVLGSSLPAMEGQYFSLGGDQFAFEGQVSDTTPPEEAVSREERLELKQHLVGDAMLYLNAPYLWGGRSPFGTDCSGLVQMVFKLRNIRLLRDAAQQATQGEAVNLIEEAEPGDLAFFDNGEGTTITHVGLLTERSRILHASGRVRIDPIDHEGIYDELQGKYTHKLRLIRRLI
jgi:hypothetical protein